MKLKNYVSQVLHDTAFPTHGKLGVRLSTKTKKQQHSARKRLAAISADGAEFRMRRRLASKDKVLEEEFDDLAQDLTEEQRSVLHATFFDEDIDKPCVEE